MKKAAVIFIVLFVLSLAVPPQRASTPGRKTTQASLPRCSAAKRRHKAANGGLRYRVNTCLRFH